jgi:hypothetical protein
LRRKSLYILIFLIFAALPALAANMAEEVLGGDIKVRDDYAIVVDKQTVTPDVPPVEKGGVIFVPLRFAAEALHADVTWYKQDQSATIVFPSGNTVKMKIGDPAIDLKDTQKILPVAPFLYGNRTMIPLRATAESGWYRVEEQKNAMILVQDQEKVKAYTAPGKETTVPGTKQGNPLAPIIAKAHHDPITKSLKPFVLIAWALMGVLWIFRAVLGATRGKPDGWKDMVVIALFLAVGIPLALHFMLSTYWVCIVILITSAIGLISTETYEDKLVTMASTAQGAGLICTLFGLGLLIGPAIAQRDIAAIGYGIYVKIEPTITGLTLSIILNMLFGYEARKSQV